jgi:hypothetical protein
LELLRADDQMDQARDAATELLEVAKELKHATGVRRAERALEELGADP